MTIQTEVIIAIISAMSAVFVAVISAVVTVTVTVKNRKSAIDAKFKKTVLEKIEGLEREFESVKDTQELHTAYNLKNYMEILRHKIFSVSLSLAERVDAGQKYLDHGGNGSAKVQHDENVLALKEERRRRA